MSFGNSDAVSFDFGINVDKLEPNYRYFSLLIGNNDAGKSSLLHEIVEFFFENETDIRIRS